MCLLLSNHGLECINKIKVEKNFINFTFKNKPKSIIRAVHDINLKFRYLKLFFNISWDHKTGKILTKVDLFCQGEWCKHYTDTKFIRHL